MNLDFARPSMHLGVPRTTQPPTPWGAGALLTRHPTASRSDSWRFLHRHGASPRTRPTQGSSAKGCCRFSLIRATGLRSRRLGLFDAPLIVNPGTGRKQTERHRDKAPLGNGGNRRLRLGVAGVYGHSRV